MAQEKQRLKASIKVQVLSFVMPNQQITYSMLTLKDDSQICKGMGQAPKHAILLP